MSPDRRRAREFATDVVVPILLVLLIPILAVGYVIDHNAKTRTYRSQLRACERGNLLRERINLKFGVYNRAAALTAETLEAAKTPVGKELGRVWKAAAVTAPTPVPLTDCGSVYEKPRWFWQ